MSDTVGFINKLPHDLVDAFRATLEEVLRADLLLEVVDAVEPDFMAQQAAVQSVLDELGAGETPRITVFNKIDLLDADLRDAAAPISDHAVFVSSATGEGILATPRRSWPSAARPDGAGRRGRARMHAASSSRRARTSGEVSEAYTEGGVRISGHLPEAVAAEITAARSIPARRAQAAPARLIG